MPIKHALGKTRILRATARDETLWLQRGVTCLVSQVLIKSYDVSGIERLASALAPVECGLLWQ